MELRDVQFVIEAASEKMNIKKKFSASWRWKQGQNRHRHKHFGASGQRTGRCDSLARARHRIAFFSIR